MRRRGIQNLMWLLACGIAAGVAIATVGVFAPAAMMFVPIALGGTTLVWLKD